MDLRLAEAERLFAQGEISFEKLLGERVRSFRHFRYPSINMDITENRILYLLAPLEVSCSSYSYNLQEHLFEVYGILHTYYQNLINWLSVYRGQVWILHNRAWLDDALHSANRHPILAQLNQEFWKFLANLETDSQTSQKFRNLFGMTTEQVMETGSRQTSLTYDSMRGPSLLIDPLIDGLGNDASRLPRFADYGGGRVFRTCEFIRRLAYEIRDWELDIEQTYYWGTSYSHVRGHVLGPVREGGLTSYYPATEPQTWTPSQIRGWSIGNDELLNEEQFLTRLEQELSDYPIILQREPVTIRNARRRRNPFWM